MGTIMKVSNKHLVRTYVLTVLSIVRYVVLVKYIWAYFRTFVAMHKKGGTEMCTLYDRIQTLCKIKGVSGSRMCLDLGLSKSTLSDIKSGRKKGVSTATAQKIASYFDVSVGYLLGEEENEKPTSHQVGEHSGVKQKFDAILQDCTDAEAAALLAMSQAFLASFRQGSSAPLEGDSQKTK